MRRQSRGRVEVCLFTAVCPGTLLWGLRISWASEVQRDHLEKIPPSDLHKVFVCTLIWFKG